MAALTIILQDVETLALAFHCSSCEGLMVESRTIAGEKSLTCCRCKHEVAYGVRFEACKVSDWAALTFESAPLRGR